jgi:hypothetical protein
MTIQFLRTESRQYFYAWILIVTIFWFILLLMYVDIISAWVYFFPIVFGLGVGIVSGLSPTRAFQACFFGFVILTLLIGFVFLLAHYLLLFGLISGLSAMAGAVLRRVVLHQEIESPLQFWQWALPLGGLIILADLFTIPGSFEELFVDHCLLPFFRFLLLFLLGLFALGLFVGAFSELDSREVTKSVMRLSIGAHGLFLTIMLALFAFERGIYWKFFLEFSLACLFLVVVLEGSRMGYELRNRIR